MIIAITIQYISRLLHDNNDNRKLHKKKEKVPAVSSTSWIFISICVKNHST